MMTLTAVGLEPALTRTQVWRYYYHYAKACLKNPGILLLLSKVYLYVGLHNLKKLYDLCPKLVMPMTYTL